MEDLNFLTICNDKFFLHAKYSVKKIMQFYPNSQIFVYDWGLFHQAFNPMTKVEFTQGYGIIYYTVGIWGDHPNGFNII